MDHTLFLKVIIEMIDHMLMTMMFKVLKQNLLITTNNIKLAESFMFHIQVGDIYCQIFFMYRHSF